MDLCDGAVAPHTYGPPEECRGGPINYQTRKRAIRFLMVQMGISL